MAQSMSVIARFSAKDDGFTSFMQKAGSHVASLGRSFAHGALMGAGMAAFQALTGGAANFVHELDETNSAWTSFNDNMKMLGSSRKEINRSKKALQSYAAATVYSSAEMASTYSQLAAGTGKSGKAVLQLVKGFGNLAATAPNSTQAMKTFSQQATQMAAKPKVAWEDFKLMYEQAPAAIEEVAKKMGIVKEVGGKQIGDAAKLVNLVKDGKVSTEDFFKAVQAAGNDQSLGKMAQKYKTIGQAMDGLRATIITKLQPAYAGLTRAGVKSITALMVAVSKGADAFKGVGKEFGKAFGAIGQQLHQMGVGKALMEGFETACRKLAGALKITAKFMQEHSKAIAVMIKLLPYMIGLLAAVKLGFMAFKAIDTLTAPAKALGEVAENATKASRAGGVLKDLSANAGGILALGAAVMMCGAGFLLMAKGAAEVASGGIAAIATLGIMVGSIGLLAAVFAKLGPQLTTAAVGMVAFGAAVMLCGAGMMLIAKAATQVAAGGTAAIVTFGLMAVAVGALAAVFATLGPALTVASVGMIAFGATILLIGAGIAVATAGIGFMVNAFANLNSTLPTLAQYGAAAAGSIMALGAAVLGAGATALAGGAMVMAAGALLLAGGALAIVAGAMFIAFGGMIAISAAGVLVLNAALAGVSASLTSIQASSAAAAQSLSSMQSSVSIVKAGMSAIGSAAQSAMTRMVTAFRSGATAAASSGRQAGQGFTNGLRSGLNGAPAAARSASNSVRAALRSAAGGAYSSGVQVGQGFANGIRAMRGAVASAAASLASAANRSITVTARIHSPSKVTKGLGRYTGLGYALGLKNMVQKVRQAGAYITQAAIGSMSGGVATMPRVQDFSWDSSGPAPSSDYFYGWPSEVTVVTEVDGKVLAKTTAPLMRDEIKTIDKKADRRRGVR